MLFLWHRLTCYVFFPLETLSYVVILYKQNVKGCFPYEVWNNTTHYCSVWFQNQEFPTEITLKSQIT